MTKKDIDDIISIICPNDENFEKPIISPAYLKKELEALALEQEPCEDAISRQAVCKIIEDIRDCVSVNGYWAFLERLKKLPPVNPKHS